MLYCSHLGIQQHQGSRLMKIAAIIHVIKFRLGGKSAWISLPMFILSRIEPVARELVSASVLFKVDFRVGSLFGSYVTFQTQLEL